eukprot:Gb_17145 [translate_table: standard]
MSKPKSAQANPMTMIDLHDYHPLSTIGQSLIDGFQVSYLVTSTRIHLDHPYYLILINQIANENIILVFASCKQVVEYNELYGIKAQRQEKIKKRKQENQWHIKKKLWQKRKALRSIAKIGSTIGKGAAFSVRGQFQRPNL